MTTPLDPSTFRLWLTLGFRPRGQSQRDDFLAVLQPDMAQAPLVQGGSFAGETLLVRWLKDQPNGESPDTRFRQTVSEALLDYGVNPWEKAQGSTIQVSPPAISGFDALSHAILLNDEVLITRILSDPRRPDWPTITTTGVVGPKGVLELVKLGLAGGGDLPAMLLRALVNSGLDPNWIHTDGNPLIFHAPDTETAQWLQAHNADLQARNSDGEGVFAYKSRTGALSNDTLRREWAHLVGPKHFEPSLVWGTAKGGKYNKVKLLFPESQSLSQWRWQPDGVSRELNVLDAAALGDVERRNIQTAELSACLIHEGTTWPKESLRLAALASIASHQPQFQSDVNEEDAWAQAQENTMVVKKGATVTTAMKDKAQRTARQQFNLLPITPNELLLGMDDFMALATFDQLKYEAFKPWAMLYPSESWREAVLDRWLTWTAVEPEHWHNSSALGWRHLSPLTDKLTFHDVVPTLAARHQAAVLGAALVDANKRLGGANTREKEQRKNMLLAQLPDLLAAETLAKDTAPPGTWESLHLAITQGEMGPELVAAIRQLRAEASAPVSPSTGSPRPRARP